MGNTNCCATPEEDASKKVKALSTWAKTGKRDRIMNPNKDSELFKSELYAQVHNEGKLIEDFMY